MPKQTKLERAIAQVDSEIEVLQAVRKRLADQQTPEKTKRPTPKKGTGRDAISAA